MNWEVKLEFMSAALWAAVFIDLVLLLFWSTVRIVEKRLKKQKIRERVQSFNDRPKGRESMLRD